MDNSLDISRLLGEEDKVDPIVLRDMFIQINDILFQNEGGASYNAFFNYIGVKREYKLKAGDNTINHRLRYAPTDILVVNKVPSNVDIIINYDKTTSKEIVINSSVDSTIRVVLGVFEWFMLVK